jgi:hypothetical protein
MEKKGKHTPRLCSFLVQIEAEKKKLEDQSDDGSGSEVQYQSHFSFFFDLFPLLT